MAAAGLYKGYTYVVLTVEQVDALDYLFPSQAYNAVSRFLDDALSVETSAIADGSITNAKVSASAAIAFSKLAALPAAQILVGNGSNVATAVALSSHATISNAGALTIANSVLTPAMVAPVANANDVILPHIPRYMEYYWTNSDPDGSNDIQIFNANSPAMEIIDVLMNVTTAEGGAMTATLRTAAAGGGTALSSALDCNSTSLIRTAEVPVPAVAANSSMWLNFSGNPGTAAGRLIIVARIKA